MFARAENLSAEQRLHKNVVRIMSSPKYKALNGVFMIGTKRIDDNVPTAHTNGKDEVYGRFFVGYLTDPEFRFLLLHECFHKLYRHLITWKALHKKNPTVANMACDYVINLKITDENKDGFAVMPTYKEDIPDTEIKKGGFIGLLDERFRGMNSREVFDILMKERPPEGYPEEQKGQGGEGGEGDDGEGSGTGTGAPFDGLDEHDWEGADALPDAEKKQLQKDVDQAIRQGAMAAGKTGSPGASTEFKDLLEVKVRWQDQLREFVTETCSGSDYSTWNRPNRRYRAAGIYMPSGVSEHIGELVIAPDLSGSVFYGGRFDRIMTEIRGMLDVVKPEAVRLLYWDTEVVVDEKYGGYDGLPIDQLINTTKPKGGGGTTVTCVPKYIEKNGINPQAVIVLTDGDIYGGWGTWKHPLMWCMVGNRNATAPVGKTVHADV